MRWSLPVFAGLFFLAACTEPASSPPSPAGESAVKAGPSPADAWFARLTLEQKVAQLMVIGFDGTAPDTGLREMLGKYQVGGVIYFARNIDSPAQVAGLSNELQAIAQKSGAPGLLVAIDQEGGRVARMTLAHGFTEFPGAMALGATDRDAARAAENVRQTGRAMAEEMRAVGINTDFAPDLDVNNNPANPVIGIRSFSSDPARVARLGVALVDGLQGAGVLAFGKHFPGHGDTGTDSHVDLPIVNHPRARLETVEFVPFKAAIAANIAGIMSAHVSFPTIDPTAGLPGTLSAKVLSGLLRDELHFDGLVVTDSLEMGALGRSGFPAPRAAALALQAGADLLLFNSGYQLHQSAIAQIVAEVRTGAIPAARLDEAVRRVLRAKERFGLLQALPVDSARAAEICASPEHRALAAKLAAASITLLRDDAAILPLPKGVAPVVIGGASGARLAELVGGVSVRLAENPTERDLTAALAGVRAHPRTPVIVVLAGAANASRQIELVQKIVALGAPVVLVALREPYELLPFTQLGGTPAMLAAFGANPPALQAIAEVLRGVAKPTGHLPVELPGMASLGAGLGDFVHR
jgi:beta-N-acetylhexosaminidase